MANKYYVTRRYSNLLELRQLRFKDIPNHHHDICAVARTVEEMKSMLANVGWTDDIDWSEVEEGHK